MRETPSQIAHRIGGSKAHELASDRDPFTCWVCGGRATRGALRWQWAGANFTGQNRVRCPDSDVVCEACIVVMAGKPPNTERMWSHLVDGDEHVRVNKGQKPTIREFLRREHRATWWAAIADSGKKHIIPWCPLNAAGQSGGRVLFEDALVMLPRDAGGWALLDEIAGLLTAGATKEEVSRGEYGPRAWQLVGERLRAFETARGSLRGGSWFDLAVWLAQRDEAAVAERLEAEKAAKAAKKKEAKANDGRRKGKAANANGRGAARTPKRVPADARVQRAQALGPDPRPDARGSAVLGEPGGVANDHDPDAATGGASGGQLTLLS